MKKNMLIGLVTLGAASLLCGFDSAETAESVLQKMNEATTAASEDGMKMDVDMNLDAAINIGDGTTTSTLALGMNGGFDIAATKNPIAAKIDGSFHISSMGQGQDMTMKLYTVTSENGTTESYAYTQESADLPGEWVYSTDSSINMNELMEQSKDFQIQDYSEYGLNFELAPEASDVNGIECYRLSAVVDNTSLSTLFSKVSELTGEDLSSDESVNQMLAYLDGLKINYDYYVDAATFLPVSIHADMTGSDLTTLNALLASTMAENAEGTTAELVLNDFSIDMIPSYGSVEEITVPEEAIAAVQSGEAQQADDLADALEEAAESEFAAN